MGLEFRNSLSGSIPTPAVDTVCDEAYWATVKPNDPVVINAAGAVVKAPITGKVDGVVAAKEYMMEKELPRIVKVRFDKAAVYEVKVAAGTPVIGGEYELNANGEVDATLAVNKAVKVLKIYPEGTVLVTLL